MRVPKQRYFHLPDERDGAQYLESASQPVVSGDRVRAVDQLAGPIDHLGLGVTHTTKNALSSR
jgi:hypothetical protein